jgi:hypothetical protein
MNIDGTFNRCGVIGRFEIVGDKNYLFLEDGTFLQVKANKTSTWLAMRESKFVGFYFVQGQFQIKNGKIARLFVDSWKAAYDTDDEYFRLTGIGETMTLRGTPRLGIVTYQTNQFYQKLAWWQYPQHLEKFRIERDRLYKLSLQRKRASMIVTGVEKISAQKTA